MRVVIAESTSMLRKAPVPSKGAVPMALRVGHLLSMTENLGYSFLPSHYLVTSFTRLSLLQLPQEQLHGLPYGQSL